MKITRKTAKAIYENYGRAGDRVLLRLLGKRGLDAFTDEFIDEFILELGRDRRFTNRLNASNRAIFEARRASQGNAA